MTTEVFPEASGTVDAASEPIDSPDPQVLIPEVRQHARRRRLRNAAVGLSGAAIAAGLFIFLGSGSPSGGRASGLSSPPASGVTRTAGLAEACNKAAPKGPRAWPALTARQAVISETRGRYTAVVYHPPGSQVMACITNGRGGTATEMSNFGQSGIPRPGADQITDVGGGAGAAPGFAGATANQHLRQRRGASTTFKQRLQRLLALGVESDQFGLAANNVSAVTFDFTHGPTVDATVHNGWYFAWWPNLDHPTSVQITTTSGQTQTDKCSPPARSASPPPC